MICHTETAQQLKTNILQNIERRFKQVEHVSILAISTLLDPRFKKIHFTQPLALSNAIKKLNTLIVNATATELDTPPTPSTSEPQSNSSEFDFWAPHKQLANNFTSHIENQSSINSELQQYFSSTVTDINSDSIVEWNQLKSIYPTMYNLSVEFLAIQATSVPSERLFSLAGNVITEKRNRLSDTHLEEILLLNNIFKNEKKWVKTFFIFFN